MEVLHTILLGSCKHIMQVIIPKLTARQKLEVQARVRAFNTSGFTTKLYGSVCYYYQSFVGRDFKGWAQMSLFVLNPYLSNGDKKVLLAFSKVSLLFACNDSMYFFLFKRYLR